MTPVRRSNRMKSKKPVSFCRLERIPLTVEMRKSKKYIARKTPQLQKKISKPKATGGSENSKETAHDTHRLAGVNYLNLSKKLQAVGSPAKLSIRLASPGSQESLDKPKPAVLFAITDAENLGKSPGIPTKQTEEGDDLSKKTSLLSALNLVETTTAQRIQAVHKTKLPPEFQNKLLVRRSHIVRFFKSNPLPISSTLGRNLIRSGSFGQCTNPAAEVARYDKFCTSHEQRNRAGGVTNWPIVNTRRAGLKPGQYCHKLTFGTRQRVIRNVELTIGVSAKSFPMLNMCRDFNINVQKMSDQDIAQAMYSLQIPPQVQDAMKTTPESSRSVRRWIASEPTARPSCDIERIAEPVVLLDDICLSPAYARYIS